MTELHDPSPHNTHAAEHALPNERAVECGMQGLQSIWVLNSQVCTDGSGNIIDPYHSPYIWVPQFVDDDLAFSVKFLKKQCQLLQKLIESIQPCYLANPHLCSLLRSSSVMSHYEDIHKSTKLAVFAVVMSRDVSTEEK